MQAMRLCKRCLLEDLPDERALYDLICSRVALLPDGERASGAEYARRLALCRSCDQLRLGACAQCGCYVEIRAAKQNMRCAHSMQKW